MTNAGEGVARPASASTPGRPDAARDSGPSTTTVAWVHLVAGLIGFAASFVLAVEKYWLLTNPFYQPSCSLNEVVSCGPIMSSVQAAVLGFPNPYLGIAGFAVVAATGAMRLVGGRIATWYRAALLTGAVAGSALIIWLITQSLFVIEALCPYCMVVWAVTFTVLWYSVLDLVAATGRRRTGLAGPATRNHGAVLACGLAALAVLVVAVSVTW
ncbi:vitamin K epoxide reductase family protein [Cellulomonas sp. C5510]|uniref:vitamin K epoxide reductase family protein n=1 Tax=Cellulomonas sp. C5510 TaxID=2871170 RepID=UPI001C9735BE|nr:vitamin K epoxide reductase family protein [Cellulomonas sp. C5510]QZN87059.1 vitamin K epoxide reductase family protein [Cellulomonas sp. C5510]